MIEQALLHHRQAIDEIPEEIVIPPRLVVTAASGERLLERLASQEAPNRAMQELFGEDSEPSNSCRERDKLAVALGHRAPASGRPRSR